MGNSESKIGYLDGIRGVAALLVFFHHFLLAFYSAFVTFNIKATHLDYLDIQFGKSIFSVLANGHFCVDIFFVLSGFVLSRKYILQPDIMVLVSAAQRRFLRLFIPVAFTLVLSWLLLVAGLYYNVPVSRIAHSEWWLGGFWNFTDPLARLWHCLVIGTMFQGDSSFDTSMWTMSAELYGSLLVFATLALTHQSRNRLFILLLLFTFFALTGRENYTTFLFGVSLNYAGKWAGKWSATARVIVSSALLAAGLLLGSFPAKFDVYGTVFENWPSFILAYHEWFLVLGAWFLVLAFVLSPRLQWVISLRFFRFLGFISFSLYLLHPLLLGSFSCYAFLQLSGYLDYNTSAVIVLILTLPLVLLLSWIMARYVDRGGLVWSRYVYDRWIKDKPVAA